MGRYYFSSMRGTLFLRKSPIAVGHRNNEPDEPNHLAALTI